MSARRPLMLESQPLRFLGLVLGFGSSAGCEALATPVAGSSSCGRISRQESVELVAPMYSSAMACRVSTCCARVSEMDMYAGSCPRRTFRPVFWASRSMMPFRREPPPTHTMPPGRSASLSPAYEICSIMLATISSARATMMDCTSDILRPPKFSDDCVSLAMALPDVVFMSSAFSSSTLRLVMSRVMLRPPMGRVAKYTSDPFL